MSEAIKSVVSEAKNYKKHGDIAVSPRTGGVSFKYLLGEVIADTKFGPFLRVYLEYDSLNGEDRYRMGSGWSLSIPHIDVKKSSMTFEDGSCRQIIENRGKLELQYSKQEDLKLYENGLGVAYLDGRHDIFDEQSGNLTKIKSQSGHCIDLKYIGTLPTIITGHKTSYMKFTSFPWGLKVEACMADGSGFSTEIFLSPNGKVTKISPSTKDTDPITFDYYADEPDLLRRIITSAGGTHTFKYVGLKLPGLQDQTMPAASVYKKIADNKDPDSIITTKFKYGGDDNKHNYLGDESGVVWSKGIDSLFESSASYKYEVWVIVCDRKTQYIYNKFHQLVSSTVYSTDAEFYALKKTEHEYPNKASDKFIDLPASYQHPIKTTTSFSSDGSSWGRVTVEEQKHDSYGNLIESVDVMGRMSVYEYCTPKNRTQYPEYTKIPDGSLFSIKQSERYYDAYREHYNESTYTHEVRDGVGDKDSFMILTSTVSSSHDGSILKSKINEFYPKDDASGFYGYIRSFVIKTDDSQANYKQSYELLNNEASLRVKTEMLDGDSNESLDYEIKDYSIQYSGRLPLRRESKDGVIEKLKYDSDQRLIESTTTKGTSSTTIQYLYSQKSGSNYVDKVFASGIISSDADPENTYTERTMHDGLGRVCSESRQLKPSGKLVDMTKYKYGNNGMLVLKSELISYEDVPETSLNTQFEYDGLRRVTKETNPLSVVTEWAYDDVKNTVMVSRKAANEKLASTLKRADNEGQTIDISVFEPDSDDPYSSIHISYDGFGRESVRTINGRLRIKHEYDDLLFMERVIHEEMKGKEEEHQEYRETIISHDPMNMKPARISMARHPGSSAAMLGRRTFDGFGRLIEECNPSGNKDSFKYFGGLLVESKDPLGTTAKRTYQTGLLKTVEYLPEETVPDLKSESINYLYDNNNMLKKVNLVSQTSHSVEYEYHHDRSMAKKTMVWPTV
ncbi:MAG: hypothetical protein AB2669_05940 [Candidatus Thiodiazotropha endolucinida]